MGRQEFQTAWEMLINTRESLGWLGLPGIDGGLKYYNEIKNSAVTLFQMTRAVKLLATWSQFWTIQKHHPTWVRPLATCRPLQRTRNACHGE